MHFPTLTLAVLTGAASLASAKTIAVTARTSLRWDPETITAAQGDVLEFHFEPANHSVAMGEFGSINGPCVPANVGGFFSGFMPTSSGESSKIFRVTVNDTQPMVFYCTQGLHCANGMIGVVNPSGDKTLAAYKALATGRGQSVTPPAVFGGVVADASTSTAGNGGGDSTSPSTSSPTESGKPNGAMAAMDGGAGKALLALAVGVGGVLALL